MKTNKPPKGFKKLSKLEKDFIKEAEKKNRLAQSLVPENSAEDGTDFLKTIFEMAQNPSKWDNLCKKIDKEVEKEFK